jgi:Holliday junction resolvase
MDFEHVRNGLAAGEDIEELLAKYDWKDFERAVAEIFEENGFEAENNIRFSADRRYEIDVVARKFKDVFCVDCKRWATPRTKRAAAADAALSQFDRATAFKNREEGKNIYAMIVTLLDEDIKFEKEVPIVPVWKLNDFLLSFGDMKELMCRC